ncbi:GNAT family N-acetyltransferase [Kitasatospora sp. NPDC051984]|uniref:GNAT family N-acetyltransferase n=1 Tax=Kitasatospora sp. NPDC051984 TaxID=3364059 RepID=UPI0037CAABD3
MIALRELVPGDAHALPDIYTAEAVRHLGRPPMNLPEALDRVQRARTQPAEPPRDFVRGITADGELVGIAKLHQRTAADAAVSYLLRPDTWNRGYATAAVHHLLNLARLLGIPHVSARHHPANPASGRVLRKAGFVPTGEHAGFLTYSAQLSREGVRPDARNSDRQVPQKGAVMAPTARRKERARIGS